MVALTFVLPRFQQKPRARRAKNCKHNHTDGNKVAVFQPFDFAREKMPKLRSVNGDNEHLNQMNH